MIEPIIRVFPRQTSYTPNDSYAFVGPPPILLPEHREVHVSCVFTWDKAEVRELAFQWEGRTDRPVRLGGPAFGTPVEGGFTPGLYVRPGVVFTTRGCDNHCPWCGVPRLEGSLRELEITPGNIIQDNNFLQSSRAHKEKVFAMLKTQRAVCFKGGLEPALLDAHFIDAVCGLRIHQLWLACDTAAALPGFRLACGKLARAGFPMHKILCYVLIGDDMAENEARLRAVYEAGAMPFAQLYRDFSEEKTVYSPEWNAFARMWSRPPIIRALMREGAGNAD